MAPAQCAALSDKWVTGTHVRGTRSGVSYVALVDIQPRMGVDASVSPTCLCVCVCVCVCLAHKAKCENMQSIKRKTTAGHN